MWVRGLAAMVVVMVAVSRAQETPIVSLDALKHGSLTVWVVTPVTALDRARAAARNAVVGPPTTVVEKTTGEFGQTASSVGQTSGSYGQTASSYGTNASNAGTNAGDAGHAPSTVGANASAYGTNASDHGQTASSYGTNGSSYGTNASSYGTNASEYGHPTSAANEAHALLVPKSASASQAAQTQGARDLLSLLRSSFSDLQVRVVSVPEVDLRDRLRAVARTEAYPDVLLGVEKIEWLRDSGLGLAMLGLLSEDARGAARSRSGSAEALVYDRRFAVILRAARHPEQARAFVVGLREDRLCDGCDKPMTMGAAAIPPATVAKQALESLLEGGTLAGLGDDDTAVFEGRTAQYDALFTAVRLPPEGWARSLNVQVDVTSAQTNGRLAVVEMRGFASSADTFGQVRAQAVLRKNAGGLWRVLQLTPNFATGQELTVARAVLMDLADSRAAAGAKALGVSLASPPEGDNRSAQPELWWDNKGGSAMQVVEWQTAVEGGWANPKLQVVAEKSDREHTRVIAAFAKELGTYRWRVWSVAVDGTVVLSPWRTFVVVSQ